MRIHAQALEPKTEPEMLITVEPTAVKEVSHEARAGKDGGRDREEYTSYLFLGNASVEGKPGETWPGCWAHPLLVSALDGMKLPLTDVKHIEFRLIEEGTRKGRPVYSLDLVNVNGQVY